MNRLHQSETHPDADLLSAFAEQALPQADRAGIVAHLAGCAHCREVVFLAQAAAGTEIEAAPVTAAKETPRRAWLPARINWRMAWVPAAALAAVGTVVIWMQLKSPPPALNEARVEPPRQIAAPAQPVAAKAAPAPAPPSETVRELKSGTPPLPAVKQGPPITATPTAAAPLPSPSPNAYRAGADATLMAQRNAAPQAPVAAPAPSRHLWANKQLQLEPAESRLTEEDRVIVAAKAPPVPAPANMAAFHGSAAGGPAGGAQTLAVASAPLMGGSPASQPTSTLTALHLNRHLHLPSGLDAVSSAVLLNRALAVDTQGTVFLSADTGKHWETVPVQWAGKAIQVAAPLRADDRLTSDADLQTAVSAASGEPAPAESTPEPARQASAAPPPVPAPSPANAGALPAVPAMLFKLVNDRHQTWVSTDGKVWRPQ